MQNSHHDWRNCYMPYPKELLVPESFSHPAKMAFMLCHRIFDRLEALGLERGSKILDPFAGIFTTGLVGGLRGYRVGGMELEPKFWDLAIKNICKNGHKLNPKPIIFQGDSRKDLLPIFGGEKFTAVVGSPAFAGNKSDLGGVFRATKNYRGRCNTKPENSGQSPGQMANLPEGDFQAVISSPPFQPCEGKDKREKGGLKTDDLLHGRKYSKIGGITNYGKEKGQISNLPEGDFAAVVSSPPYEKSLEGSGAEAAKKRISEGRYKGKRPDVWTSRGNIAGSTYGNDYGKTEGQISNESGETYWSACRDIYFNCYLLLKSGGFIALVVKDFVRKKQRVQLCNQTWELLQAVGFEPVERNRAWLVEEWEAATFFEANYSVKKERKSFFRRLAEKKGSPKIDFEEVLVMRKPNG